MLQTGEVIRQVTASRLQTHGLYITDHHQAVLPPDEFTQLRPEKADRPIRGRQAVVAVPDLAIHGLQEAVPVVPTRALQGVVVQEVLTPGQHVVPDQVIPDPQAAAAEGLIPQAVAVAAVAEGLILLLLRVLPDLPLVPGLHLPHQVADEGDNIGKYADLYLLQICIYLNLTPGLFKLY